MKKKISKRRLSEKERKKLIKRWILVIIVLIIAGWIITIVTPIALEHAIVKPPTNLLCQIKKQLYCKADSDCFCKCGIQSKLCFDSDIEILCEEDLCWEDITYNNKILKCINQTCQLVSK